MPIEFAAKFDFVTMEEFENTMKDAYNNGELYDETLHCIEDIIKTHADEKKRDITIFTVVY